jgi:hypothetical protein
MSELKVYNGEYFERSTTRYVLFFLIVGLVIIGSILSDNMLWWIIILVFVGGYFYILTKTNEESTITINESWISIGAKSHQRAELQGFVLEFNTKTQQIHNIVLIYKNKYEIYTINDELEQSKNFFLALEAKIPLLEGYEQGIRDKFIRKVKL